MQKNTPHHLGIIIDGNRRWAKKKKLPSFEGHRRGLEKIEDLAVWTKVRGIKILTLFVFSTENWKRSKNEVSWLMKLFSFSLGDRKKIQKFNENEIRIRIIGQREALSKSIQKKIKNIEEYTKNNKAMILNFAMNYGGRAEIIQIIKKIAREKIPTERIDENMVSGNLYAPDLDLLIRTGGEQRISNFLIWQAAYSELYFCKKYWPDFTEKDLDNALTDYANRQRRFGK